MALNPQLLGTGRTVQKNIKKTSIFPLEKRYKICIYFDPLDPVSFVKNDDPRGNLWDEHQLWAEKDSVTFAEQSSAGRSLLLPAVDALPRPDDDHHARSDEKGDWRHDCQSDPGWFDRLD